MHGFFIGALLIILPLFFGGVNITANYIACFLTFAFSVYVVLSHNSKSDFFFNLLMILGMYIFAQFLILTLLKVEHPISGYVPMLYDRELFFETLLSFLFFVAVYFLASNYFQNGSKAYRIIQNVITTSAFIVSLIGLSHWFYDNGKLFWYFEPRYMNLSDRARWPFVNPNHLGNFLLLSVFLQISKVVEMYTNIAKEGLDLSNLSSSRLQNRIIKLCFSGIILLTMVIGLAATLSRGSWTGFGVGVLFYLSGYYLTMTRVRQPELAVVKPEKTERERRKRKKSSMSECISLAAKKLFKPIIFLVGGYLFLFLLNEQGQELIKGRIEYGLKYSLEDMRWTMYHDTLTMIRDHPYVGIGLGQWQRVYPRYMDESLSGINPVYLHSEPLQMLSELGIIGASIVVAISAYLFILILRYLRNSTSGDVMLLLGVASGLVAFVIAMFVEFPLRMPAIQVLFAVNLALLASTLRKTV